MKTNLLSGLALALTFMILFTGKVVAQSDNVGLDGPATINGWIQYGPVMMIQDKTNTSLYTFNGYLNAGEFKITTNAGWTPAWGPGTNDTPASGFSGALVPNTGSGPDNKFLVQTAGNYSVTADLTALTINITPMTETTPILVNRLFIIGSATANGWNLATAPELTKTPGNPWEYTYTGQLLSTGSFKFATSKGDFGQKMYVKTSDVLMNLGGADVQWTVPTTGNYTVIVNTNTLAISITQQTATYIQTADQDIPSLESTIVKNELKVNNFKSFNYQIFTISGATLKKGVSISGLISVSDLNKGIYLLKADNRTFKFVKE